MENNRTLDMAAHSMDPWDIMTRLYDQSRRIVGAVVGDVPPALLGDDGQPHDIALPEPAMPSDVPSLHDALCSRSAIRFWEPTAVPIGHIATILDSAREDELSLNLVAWNVEGLAPAVYRYVPATHALRRIGVAPESMAAREELVLQVEFAAAPFVVLVTGNLAAACAKHGGFGHRQLLMRAGAAGHRMWLASLQVGLVGTVFAGFIGNSARDLAQVDGYRKSSLLAFAAGYRKSEWQ